MHPICASTSRAENTLIWASIQVLLGLIFFEKDDTKNLHSDVYQSVAPIIIVYSLVSLLEKGKKNGLTQPIFGNHPMQAWAQGLEARLVNLRWDAILSGGSAFVLLSDVHLLQSWRVYFVRVGFRHRGRRWGCCVIEKCSSHLHSFLA